jgi:hypothetical protein
MPKWPRFVLVTFGVLNLVASGLGAYCASETAYRIVSKPSVRQDEPYFGIAFWVMTGINVVFLCVLLATAVQFIRLKTTAVRVYSIAVLGLIAYDLLIGGLWAFTKGGVGMSIGGASGVGNMGAAPFTFLFFKVPYVYPFLSVICLWLARKRLRKCAPTSVAP